MYRYVGTGHRPAPAGQLQTAFIIGTSYAIAKLAPKRLLLCKYPIMVFIHTC